MRIAVLLLAAGVVMSAQAGSNSLGQAEQFERKLQQILANGNSTSTSPTARRTQVSESEVNAYLRVRPDLLPLGVTDPSVSATGAGRLSGRAIVDLDAVRERGSGSLFDPKTYLTGRLPVTAAGILHTRNGSVRFELQSAAVGGVPIPKSFLQELVSYYTRSSDYPRGISIDQVYELPASIKEIQVGEGHAIVVQ
jgi:hypothetical protein